MFKGKPKGQTVIWGPLILRANFKKILSQPAAEGALSRWFYPSSKLSCTNNYRIPKRVPLFAEAGYSTRAPQVLVHVCIYQRLSHFGVTLLTTVFVRAVVAGSFLRESVGRPWSFNVSNELRKIARKGPKRWQFLRMDPLLGDSQPSDF